MPALRPVQCLLLLLLSWAALYLPALGKRELQGEEARRVLPGRTMMQNGDWALPRSGGAIYNRKPPLVNWMSAAAISLSGRMDEVTVRMPSTLMMLALGLAMFFFLRGWLGNEQALLAALIALTSIGFIEKGRQIEIEALYMSLFGIALSAWLGLRWQGRVVLAWVVSGLVLGLGFLAKGPPHLLYFYAIVLGVLAAEGRLRDLARGPHVAGLLCFFAVWVPWAIVNSQRNVQKDSGKVWAEQITHRLGFVEFSFTNYLLQIPQSLANFLPWALLLPLCWWVDLGQNRHGQWLRGLRKGMVWSFFLIALLPSSRPRFMLPLNVAAAILVAETLVVLAEQRFFSIARGWRWVTLGLALLGSLAILVSPWTQAAGSTLWGTRDWADWAALLVMLLPVVGFFRIKAWPRPLFLGLGTAAALGLAITAFAFQTVSRTPWEDELREFAAGISAKTGPTEPVLLVKVGERMWPFYLGQRCYETELLKDRPPGISFQWIIVSQKSWKRSSDRQELVKLFGKPVSEEELVEPHGKDRYVLVRFLR